MTSIGEVVAMESSVLSLVVTLAHRVVVVVRSPGFVLCHPSRHVLRRIDLCSNVRGLIGIALQVDSMKLFNRTTPKYSKDK